MHRGDFHRARHRRRAAVQRAAEDEREAQHIVDLIRKVGAPGGDDRIAAYRLDQIRHDLRQGIRERQNQRVGRHCLDHLRLHDTAGGQTEKNIGARADFGQLPHGRVLGKTFLVRIHQRAAPPIDDSREIGQPYVGDRQAQVDQQIDAGKGLRACPGDRDLDLVDVLADDLQRVQHRRCDDDRRAVLVVMKNQDFHSLAQLALDVKTLWRLDVFEVHAAESRFQRGDDAAQLIGVSLVDFDVEHIATGKFLEQHCFAFHDRFGGQRSNRTKAEHRGAVGDHCEEIAAPGVAKRIGRIGHDLLAGGRDPRRIGHRQIGLIDQRLRRRDGNLSRARELVVSQRGFAQAIGHERDPRRVEPNSSSLRSARVSSECRGAGRDRRAATTVRSAKTRRPGRTTGV